MEMIVNKIGEYILLKEKIDTVYSKIDFNQEKEHLSLLRSLNNEVNLLYEEIISLISNLSIQEKEELKKRIVNQLIFIQKNKNNLFLSIDNNNYKMKEIVKLSRREIYYHEILRICVLNKVKRK